MLLPAPRGGFQLTTVIGQGAAANTARMSDDGFTPRGKDLSLELLCWVPASIPSTLLCFSKLALQLSLSPSEQLQSAQGVAIFLAAHNARATWGSRYRHIKPECCCTGSRRSTAASGGSDSECTAGFELREALTKFIKLMCRKMYPLGADLVESLLFGAS